MTGRCVPACVVLLSVSLAFPGIALAAHHRHYPVVYNYPAGVAAGYTWSKTPPGANDWSCRPTAAHPHPVVLVPAEGSMGSDWHAMSPLLANHGYCVFALDYGDGGTAPMERSSVELRRFVHRVLAATHSRKVDLVGHSEGGVMARYYVKFRGGRRTVRRFVALAPLSHGTTLNGIATLAKHVPGAVGLVGHLSAADAEMVRGSAFMHKLNAAPEAPGPVRYTVVATRRDEVATPYRTAFLSGRTVTNITLQRQCGTDQIDHPAMTYDSVALHDVLNALDPGHATRPTCKVVLPLIGG